VIIFCNLAVGVIARRIGSVAPPTKEESAVKSPGFRLLTLSVVCVGLVASRVRAQYPIMERVAQRVIEKCQTSSCEQLASKRGQPPSPEE
jgi:hypothetical protein